MDLDKLVQEKIDGDADFQTSIAELGDDEKAQAIASKKTEVLSQEFSSLKEKADAKEKSDELANNFKIRAEKAEAEAKKNKKDDAVPHDDLSMKDILAMQEAGVTSEDYDEVERVSKILGKSRGESLKDPVLKSILDIRKEERKTAQATQIKGGARGTSKVNGAELLSKAERTGEVPDTDEGMQALAGARLQNRLQSHKKR